MSRGFIERRGADIEILARGERLGAHAASLAVRRGAAGGRVRRGVRYLPAYHLVDEDAEVKLNQNESPWDVPEELKDEVARRLRDLPWNRYHQRIPQEFLARVARDAGFSEDCVIAGSGSNLILQWILEAYVEPGAAIVHPSPSFGLYPLWGTLCEARLEGVPLGPGFEYDPGSLLDAVRDLAPAVTILCLPNNPTGSELETREVRRIAEAAAAAGGILVIDEAYREFTEPAFDRTAIARELENVILVRTCSKAFSAAGMRLGYVLTSPRIAAHLRKMVPPYHLNLFAAVLGLALWERKDLFLERVRRIVAERGRLAAALAKVPGVEVFPSHANFLLVRVKDPGMVFRGLEERGILVREQGNDPALAGCLRINVGTPEEDDRLLRAMAEILGGVKESRNRT